MTRMTLTTLFVLVTLGLSGSAGADQRYERRVIRDGASGSRRSNPPPPAVGVHRQPPPPFVRRQPPPPAVGQRQPPPPAVGGQRRANPDPPHYHIGGGMLIERVNPQSVYPGDTIEIRGERFDSFQGDKIVAINNGRVRSVRVVSWLDNLIRVRIPNDFNPGSYRVLVYNDGSFGTSSNSVGLDIRQ